MLPATPTFVVTSRATHFSSVALKFALALIYPNYMLLRYVSCADSSAKMTTVQRGVSAGNIPTQTSNGGGMDSLLDHSEESILGRYVRAWAGFST